MLKKLYVRRLFDIFVLIVYAISLNYIIELVIEKQIIIINLFFADSKCVQPSAYELTKPIILK